MYKYYLIVITLLFFIDAGAAISSTNKGIATQSLINTLEVRIYKYNQNYNHFPSNDEGLSVVLKKNGYKYENPKDQWGNQIIYIYPPKYNPKDFDLYSFGKNNTNEYGEGDDISNWQPLNEMHYFPFKWVVLKLFYFLIIIIPVVIFIKWSWGRSRREKGSGHT